jgi:hypothetical protein
VKSSVKVSLVYIFYRSRRRLFGPKEFDNKTGFAVGREVKSLRRFIFVAGQTIENKAAPAFELSRCWINQQGNK